MKTRNGFVSNSSTSSFVIIGYKLDKNMNVLDLCKKLYPKRYEKAAKEVQEKYPNDFQDCIMDYVYDILSEENYKGIKYVYDDSGAMLGKVLAQDSDYRLENVTLSGEELMETIKFVQETLERDEPPSLMMGTRYC